jgi:hypothetical protein
MKVQFIFLGLMALVASALSTSCAPKKGQVSRLWSERTAADFTSALKRGRSIAETSKSAQGGTNLAAASTFAGLTPSALAYDTDGVLVTKATFDTRKADASVAASGLTVFAQKLIENGSSDLGVSVSEIKFLDAETIRMGSWITLRFGRVISSIPVRDARIEVTFLEKAGRFYLAEITNRGWGKSEEKGQSLSTPLTESQLAGVTGVKDLRIISSGVQYIPVQQSDGSAKLFKSNFYKVGSKSSELEYTLTFSGASEPTLVEAYSNRVEETIMAEAYVRSWVDGATTLVPLADATYRSSSGNAETIDKDGNVAALDPNGSVQLTGKTARVIPGESRPLTTVKLKQEGGKIVADVNDSNRAEINAYAGIVRIKKVAQQYLTDADTGFFNETLKVTTNIAQTCNAFYQGSTLNFFAKGGECANTALINDVV